MMDPILARFIKMLTDIKSKLSAIYLFGSRARGDERPDSDYDLLLVVKPNFLRSDKTHLYDKVMDVLLETGRLISCKIFKEREFKRLCQMQTPFMKNVLKEGVKIG